MVAKDSEREVGVAVKGQLQRSLWGWSCSASDCSNVNVSVRMVSYRFAKYYHWRKPDKEYTGSLCIIVF